MQKNSPGFSGGERMTLVNYLDFLFVFLSVEVLEEFVLQILNEADLLLADLRPAALMTVALFKEDLADASLLEAVLTAFMAES